MRRRIYEEDPALLSAVLGVMMRRWEEGAPSFCRLQLSLVPAVDPCSIRFRVCLPPRKRPRLASPTPIYEVGETSAAGAARHDVPAIPREDPYVVAREDLYKFVDMVDDAPRHPGCPNIWVLVMASRMRDYHHAWFDGGCSRRSASRPPEVKFSWTMALKAAKGATDTDAEFQRQLRTPEGTAQPYAPEEAGSCS
ncbi:hypothetical protein Tco_0271624 [Tanacetum coccineum]